MTINIEIPDEVIKEEVLKRVSETIARDIYKGYYEGHYYRKEIKEAVREIIKADIDNLSERAVAAAAKSIENRGIKKMLETIQGAEE